MTIAYVYKWTNLKTLQWYIGSRTKKGCHPNDGYICSSKSVKPLIIENVTNWKREIISTGNSKDMLELEQLILQTVDAKNDPRSLNKHNGDGLFNSTGHNKGKKTVYKDNLYKRIKPEFLEEYLSSGWILGTPKCVKDKISISTTGKTKPGHTKGGPKLGSIPWTKGRKETRLEVLEKQSLSHIGKTYSKQKK